jgi:hypothetical protein
VAHFKPVKHKAAPVPEEHKHKKRKSQKKRARKRRAKIIKEKARIHRRRIRQRLRRHGGEEHVLVWVVEDSPTTCDDCDAMDGVMISERDATDFSEFIDTWNGDGLPPVHPNCNCTVETEFVSL